MSPERIMDLIGYYQGVKRGAFLNHIPPETPPEEREIRLLWNKLQESEPKTTLLDVLNELLRRNYGNRRV